MKFEKIWIRNFRNITELVVDFGPRLNYFFGNNSQGKTNILEAVHFLNNSLSFRGARLEQAIPWSAGTPISIQANITIRETREKLSLEYSSGKRVVKPKISFPLITFIPSEVDDFFKESATRRNFFDEWFEYSEKGYREVKRKYNKVIEQRNNLLKKICQRVVPAWELDYWDEQVVYWGTQLQILRQRGLEEINQRFEHKINSKRFILNISTGEYSWKYKMTSDSLNEALKAHRDVDLKSGFTGVGPHRDDYLYVSDAGVLFQEGGSRGQLRSILILLKLIEADDFEDSLGESPIILLDDVLSELDETRAWQVVEAFGDRQVLLTSTKSMKHPRVSIRYYNVVNGNIHEVA